MHERRIAIDLNLQNKSLGLLTDNKRLSAGKNPTKQRAAGPGPAQQKAQLEAPAGLYPLSTKLDEVYTSQIAARPPLASRCLPSRARSDYSWRLRAFGQPAPALRALGKQRKTLNFKPCGVLFFAKYSSFLTDRLQNTPKCCITVASYSEKRSGAKHRLLNICS